LREAKISMKPKTTWGNSIPITDADKLTPEGLAEIQRKYREFPAEAIVWQAIIGDGKGDRK
jgi:hypothetical protein